MCKWSFLCNRAFLLCYLSKRAGGVTHTFPDRFGQIEIMCIFNVYFRCVLNVYFRCVFLFINICPYYGCFILFSDLKSNDPRTFVLIKCKSSGAYKLGVQLIIQILWNVQCPNKSKRNRRKMKTGSGSTETLKTRPLSSECLDSTVVASEPWQQRSKGPIRFGACGERRCLLRHVHTRRNRT
jgi:hypothetical protein